MAIPLLQVLQPSQKEGMAQAIFNTVIRYIVQNKPLLDFSDTARKDTPRAKWPLAL
jgi:hypothetical protein